jgi:hypothetical protein
MIGRIVGLVEELRDLRPASPTTGHRHTSTQQETRWGAVLRFLGWPCECETPDVGGCVYPGLGWRCGHRRRTR